MNTVTLHVGDVRDVLTTMIADGDTFDLLVTSPPFLALRSYLPADHPDKAREIGSEPTPATFLDTLYGLTADWGRLLPEWASICVELGDTMSGSGGAGGDYNADGLRDGQAKFDGSARKNRPVKGIPGVVSPGGTTGSGNGQARNLPGWPLAKSMCILPHAYTLGLAYGFNPLRRPMTAATFIKLVNDLVNEADYTIKEAFSDVAGGVEIFDADPPTFQPWRIRNVITWARPNPPVGSLGKRNPTKRTGDYKFRPACSYITVACRGTGRYFDLDAVRTESAYQDDTRHLRPDHKMNGRDPGFRNSGPNPAGAPPLDWHTDHLDGDWLWKLATAPYPGAHYATYPLTLPRRLILAMCPESVCGECGWPRERVTTSDRVRTSDGTVGPPRVPPTRTDAPNGTTAIGVRHAVTTTYTTLGFTDCGHDSYRSGRVLDPFAGSGTTAVAAALEGRDSTLIDLDPRNVDLIRRRLAEVLFVHDEQQEGNRWTWTVTAEPGSILKAVATGQLSLFAEGLEG